VTGLGAAVNVVLNVLLIPPYGMMGAAIATLAAYVVLFAAMTVNAQHVYPVPYQWRRIGTLTAAAVGLTILGKLLDVPLPGAIALALAYPFVLLALGFYLPAERARLRRVVPILR
jgi:O-antigen/teichoic acid export membrane protein